VPSPASLAKPKRRAVSSSLLLAIILDPHSISGVSEFTVNLETQEVLVKGTLPYDDVLAGISKTGKQVCFPVMSLLIGFLTS